MGIVVGFLLTVFGVVFVLWPFWAGAEGEATETDLSARLPEVFEREKREALAAIREAEFDVAMGKMDIQDFEILRGKYAARALAAMERLDEWSASESHVLESRSNGIGFCPSCSRKREPEERFCPRCGLAFATGLQGDGVVGSKPS